MMNKYYKVNAPVKRTAPNKVNSKKRKIETKG